MCLLVAFASHNRQRAKNVLFIITYDPAEKQQPIHWTSAGHRRPPPCMVVRISLQSARVHAISSHLFIVNLWWTCVFQFCGSSVFTNQSSLMFSNQIVTRNEEREAQKWWYLLFCYIVRRINLDDMWYCSGCSFRPNFFRYVVLVEASVRPISEN